MCVVVGYASRFGIDCGYCLLIWLGLLWCLVLLVLVRVGYLLFTLICLDCFDFV